MAFRTAIARSSRRSHRGERRPIIRHTPRARNRNRWPSERGGKGVEHPHRLGHGRPHWPDRSSRRLPLRAASVASAA